MTATPLAVQNIRQRLCGDESIRPLRAEDVPALRLREAKRLSAAAVRALVTDYPDRSVWLPETLEYVVLAPWRHRREISLLQEIAAVANSDALVAAAIAASRRAGDTLTLAIDMDEIRPPGFYDRAGLARLEDIITYDLAVTSGPLPRGARDLDFRRVRPHDSVAAESLGRLDQAAFPWLWWNTDEEFLAYGQTPGVQLFLAFRGDLPVAYVGVTDYRGWGHLDRMAVAPEMQGGGIGLETLAFAVATLRGHGARRVALSTQANNLRSRRLYETFGFRRSPAFDYRLFGAAHRPPARGVGLNLPEHVPGSVLSCEHEQPYPAEDA